MAFAEADQASARRQWRAVADQLRPRVSKLAELMDGAEDDVLAYMGFPPAHRAKISSTNPLERVNGEIKRRSDVVGIFPNEAAVAPPTMLPISSGGPCWIGVPCGRGMANGSASAC